MADVQVQEAGQLAGRAVRQQGAWMLPVVIALLAISIMAAAALVVVLITDEDGTTRTVTSTRTIVLPALSSQDIAAARAMKDESKAAAAISGVDVAGPTTGEAKVETAMHAITVRSIGFQQMLDNTDRAERLKAEDASSGTNAKDEAGVAAAIGGHPVGEAEIAAP